MMGETIEVSRIVKGCGAGCAFDAPGYPTYSYEVCTFYKYANGRRSPSDEDGCASIAYVLESDSHFSDEIKRQAQALIDAWKADRPPLDGERCKLWKLSLFQHYKGCYWHPTEPGDYGRGHKLVIYPVPEHTFIHEGAFFADDPRFSEEWREREKARVADKRAELERLAREVAVIDNHAAVVSIRKFYPEYDPTPDAELIARPPLALQQDWWSVCETRPVDNEECRQTCRTGIRSEHAEVDRSIAEYRRKVEEANANPVLPVKRVTLPLHCRWCGYGAEVR